MSRWMDVRVGNRNVFPQLHDSRRQHMDATGGCHVGNIFSRRGRRRRTGTIRLQQLLQGWPGRVPCDWVNHVLRIDTHHRDGRCWWCAECRRFCVINRAGCIDAGDRRGWCDELPVWRRNRNRWFQQFRRNSGHVRGERWCVTISRRYECRQWRIERYRRVFRWWFGYRELRWRWRWR